MTNMISSILFSLILNFSLLVFSHAQAANKAFECLEAGHKSDSLLTIENHFRYGLLAQLTFEELKAQLICQELQHNTIECLGRWEYRGHVSDKVELYIIGHNSENVTQAFFNLPRDYGKKEVWFNCQD